MNKIQLLYGHEINFSLSSFWDAGFHWQLGDKVNGIKAQGNEPTLEGAIDSLFYSAMTCEKEDCEDLSPAVEIKTDGYYNMISEGFYHQSCWESMQRDEPDYDSGNYMEESYAKAVYQKYGVHI